MVVQEIFTYEQMANRLGVTKGTISKRVKILKDEFPFLLEEEF